METPIIKTGIKYTNVNIGTNAFIIREVYSFLAKKAGIPNATSNLYKYLNCTVHAYEKMIVSNICSNNIRKGLIHLGVPENCLRRYSATLIKMSDNIYDLYLEYSSKKLSLSDFRTQLEKELLYVIDKKNLTLIIIANQMVRRVFNEIAQTEDTIAYFWDALAETDLDGTDIKQKTLEAELLKIASTYVNRDSE